MYPPVPPLTRFVETATTGKKKLPESHLDEHVNRKLNGLTISKLCIKLNTLGVSDAIIYKLLFLAKCAACLKLREIIIIL